MTAAKKEDLSGMQPNVGRAAIDDPMFLNPSDAKRATVAVVRIIVRWQTSASKCLLDFGSPRMMRSDIRADATSQPRKE